MKMDYSQMTKQIVDFQRYAFDNAFNMMVFFQDQAEKTSSMMVKQAAWLPEGTHAWIEQWTAAMKKGREGYKKLADDTFQQFEACFIKA